MSDDFWRGYLTACIVSIVSIILTGMLGHCDDKMETLIKKEALSQGLNPSLALAVATVESGLNPKSIGKKGEIGLFQILPKFSPVSKKALLNPKTNARIGIKKLIEARDLCSTHDNFTYVICYNNGWRHPKYPYLHPYYKRVMLALKDIQ